MAETAIIRKNVTLISDLDMADDLDLVPAEVYQ